MARKQTRKDRLKRLSEGRCPVHGLYFKPVYLSPDEHTALLNQGEDRLADEYAMAVDLLKKTDQPIPQMAKSYFDDFKGHTAVVLQCPRSNCGCKAIAYFPRYPNISPHIIADVVDQYRSNSPAQAKQAGSDTDKAQQPSDAERLPYRVHAVILDRSRGAFPERATTKYHDYGEDITKNKNKGYFIIQTDDYGDVVNSTNITSAQLTDAVLDKQPKRADIFFELMYEHHHFVDESFDYEFGRPEFAYKDVHASRTGSARRSKRPVRPAKVENFWYFQVRAQFHVLQYLSSLDFLKYGKQSYIFEDETHDDRDALSMHFAVDLLSALHLSYIRETLSNEALALLEDYYTRPLFETMSDPVYLASDDDEVVHQEWHSDSDTAALAEAGSEVKGNNVVMRSGSQYITQLRKTGLFNETQLQEYMHVTNLEHLMVQSLLVFVRDSIDAYIQTLYPGQLWIEHVDGLRRIEHLSRGQDQDALSDTSEDKLDGNDSDEGGESETESGLEGSERPDGVDDANDETETGTDDDRGLLPL